MAGDRIRYASGLILAGQSYVDKRECQDSVKDKDLTAPPGGPSDWDRYIVATGGTGAWLAQDGKVATWNPDQGPAWVFVTPTEGMLVLVDDEASIYKYSSGSWAYFTGVQNLQNAYDGGGTVDLGGNTVRWQDAANTDYWQLDDAGAGNINLAGVVNTFSLSAKSDTEFVSEAVTSSTSGLISSISGAGSTTGSSGANWMRTGTVSGSGSSGWGAVQTGTISGGASTGSSGTLSFETGQVQGSSGTSGYIRLISGSSTHSATASDTGYLQIASGTSQSDNNATGALYIATGFSAGTGTTGLMSIKTGNSAGGISGDVRISVGSTVGTQGTIQLQDAGTTFLELIPDTHRVDFDAVATTHLLLPSSSAGTPADGCIRWNGTAVQYYDGGWGNIDTDTGVTDLQGAYDGGQTITIANATGPLLFRSTGSADYFRLTDDAANGLDLNGVVKTIYLNASTTCNISSTELANIFTSSVSGTISSGYVQVYSGGNTNAANTTDTGYGYLRTGNTNSTAGGKSGGVSVYSGANTGSGDSGAAKLYSGPAYGAGGTGDALVYSGTANDTGDTGIVRMYSGSNVNAANASNTGSAILSSGASNSTAGGQTGTVFIYSGAQTGSANAGSLSFISGAAVAGVSGAVTVASGNNVTAANASLTGGVSLRTGNSNSTTAGGSTGVVRVYSGAQTGTQNTGALLMYSSDCTGTAGNSGYVRIETGDCSGGAGNTGDSYLSTGDNSGTGTTGRVAIDSGVSSGVSGNTGILDFRSGNNTAAAGTTGYLTIYSGYITDATNTSNTGTAAFGTGTTNSTAGGDSGTVAVHSGTNTGSGVSGDLRLYTGDTSGVGDSGDIDIYPGTSASGSQGIIKVGGHSGTPFVEFDSNTDRADFDVVSTTHLLLPSSSAGTPVDGCIRWDGTDVQYYDSGWVDINSGVTTLQGAYDGGQTITVANATGPLLFQSTGASDYFRLTDDAADGLDLVGVLKSVDLDSIGTITLDTQTAAGATGTSDITLTTGDQTGTAASGDVTVDTGATTDVTNATTTGGIYLRTGTSNSTGGGVTGSVSLKSGYHSASGDSGTAVLGTGYSSSGDSGSAIVSSGNAVAGTSGDVRFIIGEGGTLQGSIQFIDESSVFAQFEAEDRLCNFNVQNTTHLLLPSSSAGTPTDGCIRWNGSAVQYRDTTWKNIAGTSSPGGVVGDIQYNDGASGFAGEAQFNWNAASDELRLGSAAIITTGGEVLPDVDDGGVCLQQNGGDANILTFKSTDVAHTFTTYDEADTYGSFRKRGADDGGLNIYGYTEQDVGVALWGWAVNPDSTTSTASSGILRFGAATNSGTTGTAIADADNLFSLRNWGSTKLLVKGDGSIHITGDGTIATGGEAAPDVSLGGLCLQQKALSDNILTCKSSSIAHGVTTLAETDTYALFKKNHSTDGALAVYSFADTGVSGLYMKGIAPTANTSPALAGVVDISASKISGTGITNFSGGDTVCSLSNHVYPVFTLDGEGNVFLKRGPNAGTSGRISCNESSPDVGTSGICLQQLLTTGNVLTFKSTDVAHGMTTYNETDTYLCCDRYNNTSGGLNLRGLTEAGEALQFEGFITTVGANGATEATSSLGAVIVKSAIKSGTTVTTLGADDNTVVFRNNTSTTHIFKGNGDLYIDGTVSAYDDEDDIMLVRAFNRTMSKREQPLDLEPYAERLEELGVWDNGFISTKKSKALVLGSMEQLWNMLRGLARTLGVEETALLEMAKDYS